MHPHLFIEVVKDCWHANFTSVTFHILFVFLTQQARDLHVFVKTYICLRVWMRWEQNQVYLLRR